MVYTLLYFSDIAKVHRGSNNIFFRSLHDFAITSNVGYINDLMYTGADNLREIN